MDRGSGQGRDERERSVMDRGCGNKGHVMPKTETGGGIGQASRHERNLISVPS